MDADGAAGVGPDAPVLPAAARLAEIPGISPDLAAANRSLLESLSASA